MYFRFHRISFFLIIILILNKFKPLSPPLGPYTLLFALVNLRYFPSLVYYFDSRGALIRLFFCLLLLATVQISLTCVSIWAAVSRDPSSLYLFLLPFGLFVIFGGPVAVFE